MKDFELVGIRIRGNPYARAGYFATDVKLGSTRTPSGSRICALSEDFLLGFREAMIYECGTAYRSILKSAGVRWGQRFVKQFDRFVTLHFQSPLLSLHPGVVITLLQDAFAGHGWGKLFLDKSVDPQKFVVVRVANSVIPDLITDAEEPVDLMMTGFLAAVFSHLYQAEWSAVQTACPSRGDEQSFFLLMSPKHIERVEKWISGASRLSHGQILERISSEVMD